MSARPPGQLFDFHNHTHHSYDASLTLDDYRRAHVRGLFDVVAITDHNTMAGAFELAEAGAFGVIPGEEIDTADGELIGLYLREPLPLHRPAVETAELIRAQGGLVYLQHPFYRYIRNRLPAAKAAELAERGLLDIVEGLNGGPLMAHSNERAVTWARDRGIPVAAGSDAHYPGDVGRCTTRVPGQPADAASLLRALAEAVLVDRSRSSLASVADRVRYMAREQARVWRGGEPAQRGDGS